MINYYQLLYYNLIPSIFRYIKLAVIFKGLNKRIRIENIILYGESWTWASITKPVYHQQHKNYS